MWIYGVIGLAAAAVCAFLAYRLRALHRDIVTTETSTIAELHGLHGAAAQAAGVGYFVQKCEIAGAAMPAPAGSLTSEISGAECVWHKHVVTRKYWTSESQRDSNGRTRERRVQREERVAEQETGEAFLVDDGTGQLLVRPAGAVEHMTKTVDRFEPHEERAQGTELAVGGFKLRLPSRRREGTIGYQHEEWLVRPGEEVYVLGEVSDASGTLTIEKPDLVSMKDEETLLREGRRRLRLLAAAGALSGALGSTFVLLHVLG